MIRLVIVQNIIVPYEVSLFVALAKHLDIDLTVYFCKRTYKERKWDIWETKQYKYEVLRGITFESPHIITSFNPGIISRLRRNKPDVIVLSGGYVHITMLLAFLFGKAFGIPIIYRSDETKDTRARSLWLAKLVRPIEKYITRNSQAIICPGSCSKEYHIENGASPEKVFVVPYTTAYDDSYIQKSREFRCRRDEIKSQFGIRREKVILFVGQFIKSKGIIYLLEAFKKLSQEVGNIALVLLGSGPLAQEYKEYCHENNLENVYFPGFADGEQKIMYYSIADVFVLPTLKDRWGLVINEAMLVSLPVIATKAAGAARDMIIPGENGLVVDEANSEQLYLALREIISNNGLASQMGVNSSRMVESRFNMDQRVEGFMSAIKHAMKYREIQGEKRLPTCNF